jgi:1-acyl-sn-glycerol-3-phosphate acyltransferase
MIPSEGVNLLLANFWYKFGRFLVSILARGILEVSIHWKAPLPEGPVILAANHPSTIDPALVTTLLSDRVSILIRGSLFKIPLFGRSMRFCGHVPVVRGHGQEAMAEAEKLLKAGRSVVIFPEGEISPEGGLHKPHTGMARLALSTGAPVVPLGIHLDHKQVRLVETRIEDQDEVGAWYFHGPYAITVGQAQSFQGDVENHEMVQQVSATMMRQISLLAAESALRVRLRRRMTWLNATRWWLWSPVRLVQYWSALEGVKAY